MERYEARKLVSVANGPMFGPGEIIPDFDPEHPDNARLLEDYAVIVVTAPEGDDEPPAEAEQPAAAAGPEKAAESSDEGGATRSPKIEDVKTPAKTPRSRSAKPEEKDA